MSKLPYSRVEIGFIWSYIQMNGHMTYKDAQLLHSEYVQTTGSWRPSGAIYMAAWRFEQGYYDHLC